MPARLANRGGLAQTLEHPEASSILANDFAELSKRTSMRKWHFCRGYQGLKNTLLPRRSQG
jgi:hypothetical protein